MGADRSFDAAEQEIVPPAARGQEKYGGAERDSPDLHFTIVNYFAIQSQARLW